MHIFDKLSDYNMNEDYTLGVFGLTDELKAIYLANLYNKSNDNILVITNNLYQAQHLYESLLTYQKNTLLFPMDEFITSEAIAISPDLKNTRVETLNKLCNDEKYIIITHLMGYLRYLVPKQTYMKYRYALKPGDELDFDDIKQNLVKMGYTRTSVVNKPGDFALRGNIIDIYSLNYTSPIRIEFWGDEIESIRLFDPEDQRTRRKIEEALIIPYIETIIDDNIDGITKLLSHKDEYMEVINEVEDISNYNNSSKHHKYLPYFYDNVDSIYDYVDNPITVFIEYTNIKNSYLKLEEDKFNWHKELLESKSAIKDLNYMHSYESILTNRNIYISHLHSQIEGVKFNELKNYTSKDVDIFYGNLEDINSYLSTKIKDRYTILLSLNQKSQIRKLDDYLRVKYTIISDLDEMKSNKLNVINMDISKGFEWIDEKILVLTEKELFNQKNKKHHYRSKYDFAERIKNYKQLNVGDYVVHEDHGIGRYMGLVALEQRGVKKDFLHIGYKGTDKLYIPVDQIHLIQKYAGANDKAPKVHKLGGIEWEKTKQRVKKRVNDIAGKLLKLYAERETKIGYSYSADGEDQQKFEDDFIHNETPDQLRVIDEIKQDMESPHPMDRLVCGDVGYGKTEIAIRAAFKAIMDGKQVAYLCPTTILSKQHYDTAINRFKNFAVNIGILNRFTPKSLEREIISNLKTGGVDFVIGTHRLLSKDVVFNDLGLLVIDEEQRFGVEHKERLKELKTNVDVITLSATPIPRTLQMSMVGMRSLSLLETPPKNRYPIQTYVIEENESLIKDAIERELARGGQVFALHNRTSDITSKVRKIQRLVPYARVTYAHGKMPKKELENRIMDFIAKEYDVLVCTTIIETGIDIPNTNTLIIFDSDRFGLSQLYQIRGRVGRSDRIAYAYLMYQRQKVLTEKAQKRLKVIKEFTELGSGFKIAMRDLSIRGAGDLLGSEQAGFIDTVGIEMYSKMLKDAINNLKGETVETVETSKKLIKEIPNHISDNYISDNDLKIELHQDIKNIKSMEDFEKLKEAFIDRFGSLPEELELRMYEVLFNELSKQIGVEKVDESKTYVSLLIGSEVIKEIGGDKLFETAHNISRMIRFQGYKDKIKIIIDTVKIDTHWLIIAVTLFEKVLKNR